MSERLPRILHCPSAVGGHPQGLACAERKLGLESVSVAFEQNYLNYQTDEVLYKSSDRLLAREAKRWALLRRALREFDIVHFNFGRTIMPMSFIPTASYPPTHRFSRGNRIYDLMVRLMQMRDLPLLKRAGKGIVVTYQGDDARQGDYCRKHFAVSPAHEVQDGYYTSQSDARKRRAISMMARYADKIYALNPDLLHVLPSHAEFLPYASVDPAEWLPVEHKADRNSVPVVLHAPSHRGVKGTGYILDAVKQLREDGLKFEFLLVEQLSRAEARRLYERADLLIDNLLVGWYGGLAVELMALGKPVICYIREGDVKFVPTEMRDDLPVIPASPDTISEVLKKCLTAERPALPALGRRSRAYVEKWHAPLKIAARLKDAYGMILSSKVKGYVV
jgi:glycosyltransferase involved in cell wall biosynthesis